ncbi:MAG: hypothetical protein SFW36_11340 [Leptolyngbyaceae cyanobacterium bins.59]|nr:hypothetical protein [Leptolyngbyaceae cyanobacterium bins.59]
MQRLKWILATLVLFVNLLIAQPSWADPGKFIKSADYLEVTQAIDALIQAKNNPDTQENGININQKLASLQLQKYILETSEERARCSNQTGKNLAVYLKPKKATASQPIPLSYLGAGESSDDDFTCAGVYLPAETQVEFSPLAEVQTLAEPLVLKIVEGTQFTVAADPETGLITFNIPPAQLLKGEVTGWTIPVLAQADIDAQTPNAAD